MSLYAFYPYRADGSSGGLETFDLPNEGLALARARAVLADHRSCVEVVVWQGERRVGSVARAELETGSALS